MGRPGAVGSPRRVGRLPFRGQYVTLVLFLEYKLVWIADAVDVQPAVQMIELVLKDRGQEALRGQTLIFALQIGETDTNVLRPLDESAQTRNRQAAFPVARRLGIQDLDPWVDANREGLWFEVAVAGGAPGISMMARRMPSLICGAARPMPP